MRWRQVIYNPEKGAWYSIATMAADRRSSEKPQQPIREEAGRYAGGSPAGRHELDVVRNRLYSRTTPPPPSARHQLVRDIGPHRIDDIPMPPPAAHSAERPHTADAAGGMGAFPSSDQHMSRKRIMLSGYRAKVIAVGVVFFAAALILSSSFLFFGQNTISGDNITISVDAPFAIGGGEALALQIAITNKNAVAVDSATLIVEYPPGAQETGSDKELFQQRIPLGNIKPGEVLRVPAAARLFGEENEEKEIRISVEYRVEGSNATFFKEAEPTRVKISSSPVVLSIEGVKEISSGQTVELSLVVASNSSVPLEHLVIEAEYPFGFDFTDSNPKPAKGQTIWTIDSLAPEAKQTIVVKGVMVGVSAEERTFRFSAGVPNDRDRFSLASVLTTASADLSLKNPFVGLNVEINGSTEKVISAGPSDTVHVTIIFQNTLSDTIYDGTIKAALGGSGLSANAVDAGAGFFESSSGTVLWDRSRLPALAQIAPGREERVSFSIAGASLDARRTPQITLAVSVSGRRVSESEVPQALTDIVSRTVRFESVASLSSRTLYTTDLFANNGPVPPQADTTTQYAIALTAAGGSNELAGGVVTMTLPPYVTWLGATSGGTFLYTAATREVEWTIGSLEANGTRQAAFQVALLPSVSQIGTVPALVGTQNLRATDRFTGTVVRASADPLSTAVPDDPNPDARDGRVEPKD